MQPSDPAPPALPKTYSRRQLWKRAGATGLVTGLASGVVWLAIGDEIGYLAGYRAGAVDAARKLERELNTLLGGRQQTLLNDGLPAPSFTLSDLAGTPHALSSYRGKPVLLNFWETWCPPCRQEMPSLAKYSQEHPELVVLGVTGETHRAKDQPTTAAFIKTYNIPFTVLRDPGQKVFDLYHGKTIPTTYLISKDGKVTYAQNGAQDFGDDQSEVREALDDLLKQ